MVRDRTSRAIEDYIRAIYDLTRGGDRASTNDIAERLGVSPASVTSMVQRLAGEEQPLLDYEKHRGAALTGAGEQVALEVIRHHRLIETYLHEKLGYAWDEVHEEAHRLEHVISEDLEERMAQALGNPRVDPHGEPIPSRDLVMPAASTTSLRDLAPGERAVIVQVRTDDPALLRYLASIGLTPERHVVVHEVSAFDGNAVVEVEGAMERVVLGPQITDHVFVEREEEEGQD